MLECRLEISRALRNPRGARHRHGVSVRAPFLRCSCRSAASAQLRCQRSA